MSSAAKGFFKATIDPDNQTIAYELSYDGIDTPLQAQPISDKPTSTAVSGVNWTITIANEDEHDAPDDAVRRWPSAHLPALRPAAVYSAAESDGRVGTMSWPGADRIPSVVSAGFCCAFLASASHAEDIWGGSLAVTSDYRVRGMSQTRGKPAVQGGIRARWGGHWFAGVWASTMDRNPGPSATAEIDTYFGFAWDVAPDWAAKLALTHYWYPNDPARTRYDYDEISASITYRSQLSATVSWSPNTAYFGYYDERWRARSAPSASYEITALQPLTASFSLIGGVGYNDLSRLFDHGYWYWNAGVSWSMGSVHVDLSRIDSDSTAEYLFGPTVTDAGWSAAIAWRF